VLVLAYMLTLVCALLLHLFVTLMVILKMFSGLSPIIFLKKIRPAQSFAFSTASLDTIIPITLRCVTEGMGAKNSVASFCFGATINMDGTAIMQGVTMVFLQLSMASTLGWAGI